MCTRDYKDYFMQPDVAPHRRYEALRSVFVEEEPMKSVAQRLGPTRSSRQHLPRSVPYWFSDRRMELFARRLSRFSQFTPRWEADAITALAKGYYFHSSPLRNLPILAQPHLRVALAENRWT